MGEKNLEQRLLALSPDNPIGGVGGVLAGSAPRGTSLQNTSDALAGIARKVGLHGFKKSVCAIGAFDGVHIGHRALIARAHEEALARGDELVVVTFSPDPSAVLCPEHPQKMLLSDEGRLDALRSVEGVDRVIVLDFTSELAALSYERFVRETLGELMDLDVIVVGSDFRLGAGGAGTVDALSELGRIDGFDVIGMDLLDEGGSPVTATRIRGLLGEGRVEAAAGLLDRCHFVTGEVVRGRGEGTGFGFPTANVRVPESLCLPA